MWVDTPVGRSSAEPPLPPLVSEVPSCDYHRAMESAERDGQLAHLELQARTVAAQAALAQLDDSKTDGLLPEIRDQLAMMNQTLDGLGVRQFSASLER